MAKNSIINEESKINFPSVFSRLNGTPIEDTLVWSSLYDAEEYAKTDKAYVGQVLTVVTNKGTEENPSYESEVYVIDNAAGVLKPVGSGASDGVRSDIDSNFFNSLY
jgi:hypothetical protein